MIFSKNTKPEAIFFDIQSFKNTVFGIKKIRERIKIFQILIKNNFKYFNIYKNP